jgi:UDP-N-acetyl-D-glucosamine dehydrogenase
LNTRSPLQPTTYTATERIIMDRSARIGVVGLDYTGLELALSFAHAGFVVDGFDADLGRVSRLQYRKSYLSRISSEQIYEATSRGFQAREDLSRISGADVIILCARSALDENQQMDLRSLRETTFSVAEFLHAGQLVVLECTAYPGAAEQLVMPILEKANSAHLRVSRNTGKSDEIFLAISPGVGGPARTTPGRARLPKIIAGIDHFSVALAGELYRTICEPIVVVSSPSTAELIKVFESVYQTVNTALANELKQVCLRMGLNPWEVIDAVSACSCGSRVFYPGPGLGGCDIPLDCYAMSRKAKSVGLSARLVELANEINGGMPEFTVRYTGDALNERGQAIKGSRILVLGVTSEKDVDDVSESPSVAIIELLRGAGAEVHYNDPFMPILERGRHGDLNMASASMDDLSGYDAVLIATNHTVYDYMRIVSEAKLVIDARNATKGIESSKIVRC